MNAVILLLISTSIVLRKSRSTPNMTHSDSVTESIHYSIDNQEFAFPESINPPESHDARRAFGGEIILQSDFPHSAAILNKDKFTVCSSFILKPHYLLTAAHCIVATKIQYAGYGKDRSNSFWTKVVRIKMGFVHPQYKVEYDYVGKKSVKRMKHDIGLVMTEENLVPESILKNYTITDTHPQFFLQERVQVYGYGRSSASKKTGILRSVSFTLTRCHSVRFQYVICGAMPDGTKGCCSGDSGGPAIVGNYVVGVVSLGAMDCTPSHSPFSTNLFMSVFEYSDWIRNIMGASDNMTIVLASSSPRVHDFELYIIVGLNFIVFIGNLSRLKW